MAPMALPWASRWIWICLGEDMSFAMARKAELKERIQNLAPQNDAGQAERIQDVERDLDSFSWWR